MVPKGSELHNFFGYSAGLFFYFMVCDDSWVPNTSSHLQVLPVKTGRARSAGMTTPRLYSHAVFSYSTENHAASRVHRAVNISTSTPASVSSSCIIHLPSWLFLCEVFHFQFDCSSITIHRLSDMGILEFSNHGKRIWSTTPYLTTVSSPLKRWTYDHLELPHKLLLKLAAQHAQHAQHEANMRGLPIDRKTMPDLRSLQRWMAQTIELHDTQHIMTWSTVFPSSK